MGFSTLNANPIKNRDKPIETAISFANFWETSDTFNIFG